MQSALLLRTSAALLQGCMADVVLPHAHRYSYSYYVHVHLKFHSLLFNSPMNMKLHHYMQEALQNLHKSKPKLSDLQIAYSCFEHICLFMVNLYSFPVAIMYRVVCSYSYMLYVAICKTRNSTFYSIGPICMYSYFNLLCNFK